LYYHFPNILYGNDTRPSGDAQHWGFDVEEVAVIDMDDEGAELRCINVEIAKLDVEGIELNGCGKVVNHWRVWGV